MNRAVHEGSGAREELAPTAIEDLLLALAEAIPDSPAAVAFDADGTLWSGDVGEDMFLYATERKLLKDSALPALARVATTHKIQQSPDPNQQGRFLFDAFLRGELPEFVACELMAWCYAGYRPQEFLPHIQESLIRSNLRERYYAPVLSAIDWARKNKLRVVIVSASPQMVVAEAVRSLGVASDDIAAGQPAMQGGKWQPKLQYPLPYAETKVAAIQRMLQSTPLLAAFGDNVFDFEMLSSAIIQVAVRPKPALRLRLTELAQCRLLA